MIALHPQYLVDEGQNRTSVVLPLDEWELLMDELEELEDIRAYDSAKSEEQVALPFDQAVQEIREEYDS